VGLGDIAAAVGKGLFAGAAGTVAMTVSSTLEAKLRKRGSSSAPADAAGKVLGVQPRDPDGQARFSTVVHWGYGTSWGAVRGLQAAGLDGGKAIAAHFVAIWVSAQAMLPAARRRAAAVEVRAKGDRHRRVPPRRICGGHGCGVRCP